MRLIHVARRVGVGETYRAREIAAVRQVDVGQAGVAGMRVAQAAIVWAARGGRDRWIRQAAAVAEGPLLHLQVEARVREHDVAEFAMAGTRLLHDHAAVFLENPRRQNLSALRAQRLSRLGKPLAQGPSQDDSIAV